MLVPQTAGTRTWQLGRYTQSGGLCNTATAVVQELLLFDKPLLDNLDLLHGLQAHDGDRHNTG